MDSWIPWTITRNFIRAFCPTLIMLIIWDLWHNLNHAVSRRQFVIPADATALVVVLVIRLAPPLAGAHKQFKDLFRTWVGWLVAGLVLVAFLFPRHSSPDKLFWLVGYILYTDLSRVCKTDVEGSIQAIKMAYGILAAIVSQTISYAAQIREGTFPWRDALTFAVFLLVLAAVAALKWWGQGSGPMPYIQELGLNGKDVAAGAISKSV